MKGGNYGKAKVNPSRLFLERNAAPRRCIGELWAPEDAGVATVNIADVRVGFMTVSVWV